jgi:hypothetical protein
MMGDIRQGAIEAAIDRLSEELGFTEEADKESVRSDVPVVFDAVLDYLADHADEWEVQAALTGTYFITNADRIAALRITIEEE